MMTGIVLAASLTRFLLSILIVIPISILPCLQSSANFDRSLLGTKYFNPFLEDPDTHQLLTYYLDVLISTVDSSIICSLTPLTPTASHYFT